MINSDNNIRPYIISDTGPILTFLFIKRIDLLKDFCSSNIIYIPQKVYDELTDQMQKNQIPESDLEGLNFRKVNVSDEDLMKFDGLFPPNKKSSLHDGEREVFALGLKHRDCSLLVIDDKKARNSVKNLNFKIIGTIYIIQEEITKQQISVKETKEIINKLQEYNRYYSSTLLEILIKQAENTEQLTKKTESKTMNTKKNEKIDSLTNKSENDNSYKPK